MNLIFTSKLYREEFKHWVLILALTLWALIASVFAFRNQSKTILIGIDDIGTRVIAESSDRLLQSELKNFLNTFFDQYYTYDDKNFSDRVGKATEMMSSSLWDSVKDKLLEQNEKLKKNPLSQFAEIQSIDLIDQGRIEAILNLKIKSRLNEQTVRLKVNLEFKKVSRSEKNPWGFEVVELSDATI